MKIITLFSGLLRISFGQYGFRNSFTDESADVYDALSGTYRLQDTHLHVLANHPYDSYTSRSHVHKSYLTKMISEKDLQRIHHLSFPKVESSTTTHLQACRRPHQPAKYASNSPPQ